MTPEEYFSGLIQSGTEYHEAMRATRMYFPHWNPASAQPQYPVTGVQTSPYQQVQQPAQSYIQQSQPVAQYYQQPTQYISKKPERTFYAPLITLGLVVLLMFTPFLTFQHDELSNSEEEEVCELLYSSIQYGASGDDFEIDDLDTVNCPMNGFSSTFYSIETIADLDTDQFTDDTSGSDSDGEGDVESEEAMFGISLIMLFLAPIIYLLLSILALVSVGLKKYPTLVGALQLIYVILFLVFSSMGVIGDGDFELSAGGNFAGIGMYLIGFASIGYFIRK
ncbi:MAG: Uncharacterised protein [Candidatus Poseidoniaceae archaeon]|nr:MAG: Uncharacterised protein [Candidatus Poseidoniaceae archaeon]|tara:strand:+ start:854 stop:1690 length:837 start_codon:yes stop_codon:yes gene_type:complete